MNCINAIFNANGTTNLLTSLYWNEKKKNLRPLSKMQSKKMQTICSIKTNLAKPNKAVCNVPLVLCPLCELTVLIPMGLTQNVYRLHKG